MYKLRQLSIILLSVSVMACDRTNDFVVTPSEESVSAIKWTQPLLQDFADGLQVKYRVVTNIPKEACDAAAKPEETCFIAEIDLISATDLSLGGWEIYFSQMRPIKAVLSDKVNIERVKGDLHRITPKVGFAGFKKGDVLTIPFRGESWQLSEIDSMPNYYMVANTADKPLQPVVIKSTQVHLDPETGLEIRPYVESFTDPKKQYQRSETDKLQWATANVLFENNKSLNIDKSQLASSMLPTPVKQVVDQNQAMLSLENGINVAILTADLDKEDIQAALERLQRLGVKEQKDGIKLQLTSLIKPSLISDKKVKSAVDGHYQLTITSKDITLSASDPSGFSYGLASIASLLQVNHLQLQPMQVEDYPRFDYRGMHIDVSRNFHSKQVILDLLEQMATYKLNKLHLHMGDDEGWRLEVEGLPELTEIGAQRCHDLTEQTCLLPQLGSGPSADTKVNGFYSKADYIEILQFANARQIQVIPSMDMPGHSRAAIKSMQVRSQRLLAQGKVEAASEYQLVDPEDKTVYSSVQYYDDNTLNVCMESTYHFVEKVVSEIAKLHEQAGQPLTVYHIGADETAGAWKKSPICEQFIANNQYGVKSIEHVGAYFIERVANLLATKGIQPAGWSDGMSHTQVENMPATSQTHIWDVVSHQGYKRAHQQANNGWKTILSNPEVLYFDFPYEADPKEHGYYWASRALNTQHVFSFMAGNLPANAEQWTDIEGQPFETDDSEIKDEAGKVISSPMKAGRNFDGIQGQLWSETIRSPQLAQYMIFPRLLMLAERAWHTPSWEVPYQYKGARYNANSGFFTAEMRQSQQQQWQQIANHIGHKEFSKLDLAGIEYRLPTVGAKIETGLLYANTAYPGLAIEYRQLDQDWQLYHSAVKVSGKIEVRAIAPDGVRKGRSLFVN